MQTLQITLPDNLTAEQLKDFLSERYQIFESGTDLILGKYPVDESQILNKKQIIVLEYLAEGYKYTEIAAKMDMTVDGVRFYVKAIYKKLNVDNAIKAIREYQKQRA